MTPAAESRIEAKVDRLLEGQSRLVQQATEFTRILADHEARMRIEESRGKYSLRQIATAAGVIIATTASVTGAVVAIAMLALGQ